MTQYSEGVEPGSVPGGGAVPGVLLQDSVPGRSGWKHGAWCSVHLKMMETHNIFYILTIPHQSPPHPACQKARVTDWSLTRASVATRVRLECEREYQAKIIIIVLCQKYFVCIRRSTSCCRWCRRTSRPRWSGAWCWRWRTATARSSGRRRSSRTSSSRGTATSGPRQRADTWLCCYHMFNFQLMYRSHMHMR